jgi:hypothetical protein
VRIPSNSLANSSYISKVLLLYKHGSKQWIYLLKETIHESAESRPKHESNIDAEKFLALGSAAENSFWHDRSLEKNKSDPQDWDRT